MRLLYRSLGNRRTRLNFLTNYRGDGQRVAEHIPGDEQRRAQDALLRTISPSTLTLPESILNLIPPSTLGFPRRARISMDIRG